MRSWAVGVLEGLWMNDDGSQVMDTPGFTLLLLSHVEMLFSCIYTPRRGSDYVAGVGGHYHINILLVIMSFAHSHHLHPLVSGCKKLGQSLRSKDMLSSKAHHCLALSGFSSLAPSARKSLVLT
jgi:hypothetical protein